MARQSQRIKIQYEGMTSNPSDYLSPDGELMSCIGLEDHAGSKMSAKRHEPKEVSRLMSGHSVIFVHNMDRYKVALIQHVNNGATEILWANVTDGWPAVLTSSNMEEIEQLDCVKINDARNIGNTVILRSENNIHYMLWKDGTYKYLGTKIPELPIVFGLQTEYCHYFDGRGVKDDNSEDATSNDEEDSTTEYYFKFNKDKYWFDDYGEEYCHKFKDSDVTSVTDEIMAKVNRCIAEGYEKGYFMQSFLVRYALKLYDGTTTMSSMPVYMPVCHPKDGIAMPFALMNRDAESPGFVSRWYIDYMKAKLDYAVDQAALTAMQDWKDIVKGVTVGVSAPIYGYNPAGKIKYLIGGKVAVETQPKAAFFYNLKHDYVKTISKIIPTDTDVSYSWKEARTCYDKNSKFYVHTYDEKSGNQATPGYPYSLMQLPEKSQSGYDEEVKNNSLFYVYKEIKLEDLKTTRTVLKVRKGLLSTIVNQPLLKDEYQSHDDINAEYMYVYNGRLNLAGVTRKLWSGFSPTLIAPFQNEYPSSLWRFLKITYEVKDGDKTNYVASKEEQVPWGYRFYYLYYPNTNVEKIDIVTQAQEGSKVYWTRHDFTAEEHSGLNGSVHFEYYALNNGYDALSKKYADPSPTPTDGLVTCYNKLYTSNALNPFTFEPQNINTIGTGRIKGMAVAMKAISLGQAGQYPMYCMTDDGVWIMNPNENGGWSAIQPIMKDVCTVPDAIVETDGAVIMPTTRGMMMLQGEQSMCLTDVNNKCTDIMASDLPKLVDVIQTKWNMAFENTSRDIIVDVAEYLSSDSIRGIYDYKNNRVIYYRPDRKYSIVLTTGETPHLSMQLWNIKSAPKSGTGCPVMIEANGVDYLADLSGDAGTIVGTDDNPLVLNNNAMIITRPIKGTDIGIRDYRKQLDTVWHQGRYKKGSFDILLYGTEDYKKWHLIGQAKDATGLYGHHGQHWMAFILVLYIKNMQDNDAIDCVDLTMTARLSGKKAGIDGYKIS